MNKSNSAMKLYLKMTAWCTAIFTALAVVFAPLAPAIMSLMRVESIFGIDIEFSGDMEKSYINVLLMGLDVDETRSDVMMVAQFNMINNSVNILQIPRDTYIAEQKGDKKINSSYGAEGDKHSRAMNSVATVERLLDIKIDNYSIVTTSGFRDVVDAVGGIYYDVPMDMKYSDPLQDLYIDLKKGRQLLDGDKAEQYVRYRHGYANADLGRIEAQSGFIMAAMEQIIERNKNNEADTEKLITSVVKMVDTDFELTEIFKIAPHILRLDMDNVNIMMLQGEAGMKNRVSYYFADEEANRRIIDEYFTPDISEADMSEIQTRDDALAMAVEEHVTDPDVEVPEGINVYILDYSGTDGKKLEEVTRVLEDSGCNIVGSVSAKTTIASKTCSIGINTKNGTHMSEPVAKVLNLRKYYINPGRVDDDTDVVLLLGKDDK